MANNQNPPTPELFLIQPGDWPIDPYVVDGVELAARLNRAIPSEFDALKTGKANLAGNNTFTGQYQYYTAAATRFVADFSNGTQANRFMFLSSVTNGNTMLGVQPNGTATQSGFQAYHTSDIANALTCFTGMIGGVCVLDTWGSGANASVIPQISFRQNGRTAIQIDTSGIVYHMNQSGNYAGVTYFQNIGGTQKRFLRINTNNDIEVINYANNAVAQLFMDNGEIQAGGNLIAKSAATSPLGGQAALSHDGTNATGSATYVTWIHESVYNQKVGVGWIQNVGNMFAPAGDNAMVCGWGLSRWSVVYAANGTINTSDAKEKTPLRDFNAAELAAAKELADMVGVYKWLKDINEKGREEALWQIGVTAQSVDELFRKYGLNALEYGMLTRDIFPEAPPVYETDPETGEEVCRFEGRAAVDRWGANYAQINQFLIRGMHERMKDVERRLALLEGL